MELVTFKTNISTEKAVQRVATYLNAAVGTANWQLDIKGADKKLMVYSPGMVNEMQVIDAVHKAGYYAISMEDYYSVY